MSMRKYVLITISFFCFAFTISQIQAAEQREPITIKLTSEERAWLASGHTVRARVSYWPPFMFIEPEPSGIAVDYLKAVAVQTGLQIQFVPDTIGWKKSVEDLTGAKDHYDLILTMKRTPEREAMIAITDDYLFLPWVVISRDDADPISGFQDLQGKTVSVERGYVMQKKLKDEFPGINLLVTDNSLSALEAVSTGQAYAYVGDLAKATYLMKHHGLYNLKVAASTPFQSHNQAMGVRKDWPELVSIINKALSAIDKSEKQAILEKWVPAAAKAAESALPRQVEFDEIPFLFKTLGFIFICITVIITIVWLVRGRPRHLSIRDTLLFISLVFTMLIVFSAIFVIILLKGQEQQRAVEVRRDKSLDLALELKQSSDDLTRFARTYVETGDPKYEHYYWRIVAIRDGKQAHPKKFTRSYWDHVAAGVLKLDQDGEVYSIENRMIKIGLTEEEKEKLSEAKKESDDLINLEKVAMNAVKGLYKDDNGRFTKKAEPDLVMARMLMHGKEYHEAKSRIMKPIDQFFSLLESRTANELNLVRQRNRTIISGIMILVAVTIGFSIYVFFLLRRRIISPLGVLEAEAQSIKEGDYSHRIDLTSEDEVGALANVFNSMASSIEEHTSRLHATIDSTSDGILVVDLHQNVTTYNEQFLEIWRVDRKFAETVDDNNVLLEKALA